MEKNLVAFTAIVLVASLVIITSINSKNKITKTVTIKGHSIPQGEIVIQKGETIVFKNEDSFEGFGYDRHTISSGTVDVTGNSGVKGIVQGSGSGIHDGLFSYGLKLSKSFKYTFDKEGIYTFYIAEHPTISGLGRIVVK